MTRQIYKCPICKKEKDSLQAVENHTANVHATSEYYHCQFCGKRIKGAQSLRTHEILHTARSLFVCMLPNCTVRSSSLVMMIRHVREEHFYQTVYSKNGLRMHKKLTGRPVDYVAIDDQ